jgi:C4-dicarboxylate-specific signal transduction histidine kinase
VEVTVDGTSIRVRDHGPGFPSELLRDGPSRFRTADPNRADNGHGLGLTIAVAQARVLSAELRLANAADGGAEVTVALPSAP